MPEYELEQYETWSQKVRVTADSEAEACLKVLRGEGTQVDQGQEYIMVNEELSRVCRELEPELCEEFLRLGGELDDNGNIPSIRSIEEVW